MQDINQGPVYSGWLFGNPKKPFGPFSSESELWDGLHHWFHQPPTKVFQNVRWKPSGSAYLNVVFMSSHNGI